MKRGIIIALVIVVVGGGITWFLLNRQQQTSDTTTTQQQNGEKTVHMKNTKFDPGELRITKGTKVTWINDDTVQHNVVASDADNSGGLPMQNPVFGKGGSYSFTFNEAGTFTYHCTPHPFMTGTVIVE